MDIESPRAAAVRKVQPENKYKVWPRRAYAPQPNGVGQEIDDQISS